MQGREQAVVADYAMIAEYAYIEKHIGEIDKKTAHLCIKIVDARRAMMGDPDLIVNLRCSAEEQPCAASGRGGGILSRYCDAIDDIESLNTLQDKYIRDKLSLERFCHFLRYNVEPRV